MANRFGPAGRRGIAIGVLAFALVGLAACGSSGDAESEQPTDTAASTGAGAGDNEVVMRLIAYRPEVLEVSAGTKVSWDQQDAGFHTVTSGTVSKDASGSVKTNPDGTFDSGQLAKGEDFTFTFDEAGTFEYFCEIHPATMTGSVKVN